MIFKFTCERCGYTAHRELPEIELKMKSINTRLCDECRKAWMKFFDTYYRQYQRERRKHSLYDDFLGGRADLGRVC